MCTEWDTPVCQGNCIILCYVYDYFFLPPKKFATGQTEAGEKESQG